ncbi:ribonuclease H-like domain-containing protein [Tanacetum coccineum]
MFLSQKKYALEFLDRAHMASCNLTRTPVDSESKLGIDADPVYDPTLYCSLSGGFGEVVLKHFKSIQIFLYARYKKEWPSLCMFMFVYFMPSRYQHGDISTKGLPSALFEEFHNNFSVRSPVQTAREC